MLAKFPEPVLRSTVANGTEEMGWQASGSALKQLSVAWFPPTQAPQAPFSLHFCVPGLQPTVVLPHTLENASPRGIR